MCGICGIISFEQANKYKPAVQKMNTALAHRGPNAEGIWSNESVVLGHRRLSIIDLSAAGNQPMVSNDGRFILVFNGEIYNFREIRNELSEYPYRTQTDSEVILAAYAKWGIDCLAHFNGMFAFAIWDNLTNELFIVRDRLGIKPLYYYIDEEKLIFSSEIRSILATDLVPRKLDQVSLIDYMRYQTVHAPNTIIQNVKMLNAGQYITVKRSINEKQDLKIRTELNSNNFKLETILTSKHHLIQSSYYWKLGTSQTISLSPAGKSKIDIQSDILQLLTSAVERRLVADVPFGAFLSGGIDSSIIVGLMVSTANKPVNTFSVVFHEKKYSESPYSRYIAKRFNTKHTEIPLTPNEFLGMLPGALESMDHPSGDGPNTWVVSKVTKDAGITMALSGLGGDELFAGYNNFKRLTYLNKFRAFAMLPVILRAFPGKIIESLRPSVPALKIKELLEAPSWEVSDTYPITRQVLPDQKIQKLIKNIQLPNNMVRSIINEPTIYNSKSQLLSIISCAEINTYMQNVLLRDTDQMSMAHALEVRVPFLDYQLVEYILQVNDKTKYPHSPKQLLVDSVGALLPKDFSYRPKMGFVLPWDHWMHNELKTFCEDNIMSLGNYEYFDKNGLKEMWAQFLNRNPLITWSRIWNLVALSNWLRSNNIQ